jgi:hypothetical protein
MLRDDAQDARIPIKWIPVIWLEPLRGTAHEAPFFSRVIPR